MTNAYQHALIIGAGRGTGRALALQLAAAGSTVTAVARTKADLQDLANEAPGVNTYVGDGASGIATDLVAEVRPDLLILAGGITPRMGSFVDQDWESFSATWNADMKTTFDFLKAAITTPMAPESAVVTLSSGAAISGSRLSGGYAGAKRMQHYLTNYTGFESEKRGLGLRCYTVYPLQFIAGTQTADVASNAYAAASAVSQEKFMAQWEAQLSPEKLAGHVMALVDRDAGHAPGAWGVRGTGMEPIT